MTITPKQSQQSSQSQQLPESEKRNDIFGTPKPENTKETDVFGTPKSE